MLLRSTVLDFSRKMSAGAEYRLWHGSDERAQSARSLYRQALRRVTSGDRGLYKDRQKK